MASRLHAKNLDGQNNRHNAEFCRPGNDIVLLLIIIVIVSQLAFAAWITAGVVLMLGSGAASELAEEEQRGQRKYIIGVTEFREVLLWPYYLRRYNETKNETTIAASPEPSMVGAKSNFDGISAKTTDL